jgi:hypothetical protein
VPESKSVVVGYRQRVHFNTLDERYRSLLYVGCGNHNGLDTCPLQGRGEVVGTEGTPGIGRIKMLMEDDHFHGVKKKNCSIVQFKVNSFYPVQNCRRLLSNFRASILFVVFRKWTT